MDCTESWKPIPGWPYEVSNLGNVRNTRTGRVLKQDLSKGYLRATISQDGVTNRFLVHTMVCELFNGPKPDNDNCARHLDGNSTNNVASNLCWGTRSENEQDKRQHGTYQERENNPFSILTEEAVAAIRCRYAENKASRVTEGFRQVEHGFVQRLAAEYSVSVSCIKFVVSGRNWKEAA